MSQSGPGDRNGCRGSGMVQIRHSDCTENGVRYGSDESGTARETDRDMWMSYRTVYVCMCKPVCLCFYDLPP